MVAFLFPGQGSQFPGMAKDLYEKYASVKTLFSKASEACDRDMAALLFEGSAEDLKATENAQAAIVLASLAAREALTAEGIVSQTCAGHSLGEYSALVDAGVLSAEDALKAVSARGHYMAEAGAQVIAEKGSVGMAAVIGIGPDQVKAALDGAQDVWSANENGPKQVVIAGTLDGIASAQDSLKEAGARRVIPLKVSGPFHTPLMASAGASLAGFLENIHFANPTKIVWSNVSAAPIQSGDEARKLLVEQLTAPVRWVDLTEAMAGQSPSALYEVGPGSVLSGLWAKSGLEGRCAVSGRVEDIEQMTSEKE